IEGSRAWVRTAFKNAAEALPSWVVNLDGVGESPYLATFQSETALFHGFPPDPGLFLAVDALHQKRLGAPPHQTFYPALTDGRAFLELGIRAISLTSDLPGHGFPRHLHSARDDRSRISIVALDSTTALLEDLARTLDRQP